MQGYRILQDWNEWLVNEDLGRSLLKIEQQVLSSLLQKQLGKHVLLVGVPQQFNLLQASPIPVKTILSPLAQKHKQFNYIESDLHELAINTGTIDLVIIPHTLQFIERSRQLLNEVCRIIKPEGTVAILGFNPYSIWGVKKTITTHKNIPWSGCYIEAYNVKNWLRLAEFEIEYHTSCLFRPPISNQQLFNKLQFIECIGATCFPKLGGVYIVLARAKVIPLTPIRMHWKQHLSGIRINSTMKGYIA